MAYYSLIISITKEFQNESAISFSPPSSQNVVIRFTLGVIVIKHVCVEAKKINPMKSELLLIASHETRRSSYSTNNTHMQRRFLTSVVFWNSKSLNTFIYKHH